MQHAFFRKAFVGALIPVFCIQSFGIASVFALDGQVRTLDEGARIDMSSRNHDMVHAMREAALKRLSSPNPDARQERIATQIEKKTREVESYLTDLEARIAKLGSNDEIQKTLGQAKKVVDLKVAAGRTPIVDVVKKALDTLDKKPEVEANVARTLRSSLVDTVGNRTLKVRSSKSLEAVQDDLKKYDADVSVKPIFSDNGMNFYNLTIRPNSLLSQEMLPDADKWVLPTNLPSVEVIEPTVFSVDGSSVEVVAREDFSLTWGIQYLGVDKFFSHFPTTPIKVGVIDTGADITHPDLVGRIDTNLMRDFIENDGNPNDDHGHGTHVSGTIWATLDGAGVAGVYPYASIVPLKVCDMNGSCYGYAIIDAINFAKDNHINVINMSLGGQGNPIGDAFCQAIDSATQAGVKVVVAAGNSDMDVSWYVPAGCASAITVAAIDKYSTRAYFSNYGTGVDVAAPGVSVYSSYPGGGYATMSGTSMASPHVAGFTALLLADDPTLTTAQVVWLFQAFPRTVTTDIVKPIAAGIDGPRLLENVGIAMDDPAQTTQPTPPLPNGSITSANLIINPADGMWYHPDYVYELAIVPPATVAVDGSASVLPDTTVGSNITPTNVTLKIGDPTLLIPYHTENFYPSGYYAQSTNMSVATVTYDDTARKIFITPRDVGTTSISIVEGGESQAVVGRFAVTVQAATSPLILTPSKLSIYADSKLRFDVSSVTGGTGPYTIEGYNNSIAMGYIKNNLISIRGVSNGTSTFKIIDTANTARIAYLFVTTQTSSQDLIVSPMTVSMDTWESKTSTILSGNGGYTLSVANPAIASASVSSGVVTITGLAVWSTTVTVTDSQSKTATIIVNVVDNTVELVVNPTELVVYNGSWNYSEITSGNGGYTVSSSDENIALVSVYWNYIYVDGMSDGTATVTVKDAKNKTATIAVTVVSQFTVDPTSLTVDAGSTFSAQLSNSERDYSVSSSDTNVATAHITYAYPTDVSASSASVEVQGIAPGTATITVTDQYGFQATIAATVVNPLKVDPLSHALLVGKTGISTITSWNGGYSVKSSATSIATVSLSGTKITITAKALGTATITVKDAKGKTATIAVSVEKALTVTPTTITLDAGKTGTASITSWNGGYTVSSSDEAIATATVSGTTITVLAKSAGTAIITLTDSKNRTAPITVTVVNPLVVNPTKVSLDTGTTTIATITSGNGNYTFSSSNSSIATAMLSPIPTDVMNGGTDLTITGKAVGTATITIKDAKGKTATIAVTVEKSIAITPSTITLDVGKSGTATISSGKGGYTLSSSDETIATGTVSGTTITVLAKSAGTAIITVTDSKNRTAAVTVTVVNPLVVSPTKTTLDTETYGTAMIVSWNGGYTFTSSNSSVATAFLGGVSTSEGEMITIIAKSAGTATITVKDAKGKSATIAVTVVKPLTLSAYSLTLAPNATSRSITILNWNGSYTATSSNTGIAKTSISGTTVVITGKAVGTATVTVKDAKGKTATIDVTVK